MVYSLQIENLRTGYLSIETFPSRFDRALRVVMLSSQPLKLTLKDY